MKFQNLIRARNNDKKKSIRNVYNNIYGREFQGFGIFKYQYSIFFNIVFMEENFKDLEYLNIKKDTIIILIYSLEEIIEINEITNKI